MLGVTNWRTSAAAIAPLFISIGMILSALGKRQMPDQHDMEVIGGMLSAAIGLIAAKDKNVTGGSVSNVDGNKLPSPVSIIPPKGKMP
jgi:hypothetical protein